MRRDEAERMTINLRARRIGKRLRDVAALRRADGREQIVLIVAPKTENLTAAARQIVVEAHDVCVQALRRFGIESEAASVQLVAVRRVIARILACGAAEKGDRRRIDFRVREDRVKLRRRKADDIPVFVGEAENALSERGGRDSGG